MSYNSVFIDSLLRIKNAQSVMFRKVELRFSGMVVAALNVLHELGYIDGYEVLPLSLVCKDSVMRKVIVRLKYYGSMPVIRDVKIFSRPGRRVFVSVDEIPEFYSGMGSLVLTTSKGVVSCGEARRLGVGGELLCGVF